MKKISTVIVALLLASVIPNTAHAATFTFSSAPLTNLNPDGAVIHGGFSTFPSKSGLYIQQCEAPAIVGARPTNCIDLAWVSNSGSTNSILPTGDISFTLKSKFNGKVSVVDCSLVQCGLFFRLDHLATSDTSEDTYKPITFAPGASTSPLLESDLITVTLDGKEIVKNVPNKLSYRAGAKVVATSLSGLPVTLTPSTPECSFVNGTITALKGAGVCALDAATTGDARYEAAKANYPFLLVPGTQNIGITTMNLKSGQVKSLPLESNFGVAVKYSTTSKNCAIALNLLKVLRKGACVVKASAPAKTGMWSALKTNIKVQIK